MAAALFAERSVSNTVRVVAETLFARINSGQYTLNTRLPAERVMAVDFGVARNTVREALDLLEDLSIIKRRAGSGSFVSFQQGTLSASSNNKMPTISSSNISSHVSTQTSPLELQVMRGIVEPEMIQLAIINMAPRDIEILRSILDRMLAIRTEAEKFSQCEEEFCMEIARGTGNPLLAACYELIADVRHKNIRAAQLQLYLSPKRIAERQNRYCSLFEAIELRDVEAAVEYMKLHLIDEQRAMLRER